MFSRRRRRARKAGRSAERQIMEYSFPNSVRQRVAEDLPAADWQTVERGLREWLICCLYGGSARLAMPSRAVDVAWHAFILDTQPYRDFCHQVYGRFLHHMPEDRDAVGPVASNAETVWAWDRSQAARHGECGLWDIDQRLAIPDPAGIDDERLAMIRSRRPEEHRRSRPGLRHGGAAGGAAGFAGYAGFAACGTSGDAGGSSCGGGSGCSGSGGCGGGGGCGGQ